MDGIPLALDAERPPMLELLVIGNLECTSQIKVLMENQATGEEYTRGTIYILSLGYTECSQVPFDICTGKFDIFYHNHV